MMSQVYFIGIKGQPFVKVGRSRDMTGRIMSLYTALPFVLEDIGRIDGHAEVEALCHKALCRSKVYGEWFRRDEATDLYQILRAAPTVEDGIAQYNERFPAKVTVKRSQVLADVSGIIKSILETHTVSQVARAIGVSPFTVKNARDGRHMLQGHALFNLIRLKPDALDVLFKHWGRATEPLPDVMAVVRNARTTENISDIDAAIESLNSLKARCHEIRARRAA